MGRRHVWGGGDVSSLTSILSLAWCCVESLCKSHVITPPPARVCWAWGKEQSNWRKGEAGKCSRGRGGALDMCLYKCPACTSQTQAWASCFLPHFCLLCLLCFSPVSLSNHSSSTVQLNEGLGSTLPPTPGITPARKRLLTGVVGYSS